jgi:hypothetical protein
MYPTRARAQMLTTVAGKRRSTRSTSRTTDPAVRTMGLHTTDPRTGDHRMPPPLLGWAVCIQVVTVAVMGLGTRDTRVGAAAAAGEVRAPRLAAHRTDNVVDVWLCLFALDDFIGACDTCAAGLVQLD